MTTNITTKKEKLETELTELKGFLSALKTMIPPKHAAVLGAWAGLKNTTQAAMDSVSDRLLDLVEDRPCANCGEPVDVDVSELCDNCRRTGRRATDEREEELRVGEYAFEVSQIRKELDTPLDDSMECVAALEDLDDQVADPEASVEDVHFAMATLVEIWGERVKRMAGRLDRVKAIAVRIVGITTSHTFFEETGWSGSHYINRALTAAIAGEWFVAEALALRAANLAHRTGKMQSTSALFGDFADVCREVLTAD